MFAGARFASRLYGVQKYTLGLLPTYSVCCMLYLDVLTDKKV